MNNFVSRLVIVVQCEKIKDLLNFKKICKLESYYTNVVLIG